MDLLHSWGVSLAVRLQSEFGAYESWFQRISSVADLHTTFFIFFPVWFHLKRDVGVRLIWVAVLGDWLNMVLKWVLFGERPYWWVRETGFYGAEAAPALRQLPITCETGPGSPSGHAMGSAAVGYVMVTSVLAIAAQRRPPATLYWLLQLVLWTLLALAELSVCMSRVYVAAHFPHQVICGVFSGIAVAEMLSRQRWIHAAGLQTYLGVTSFLLLSAVGLYVLLKGVGVDLLWTLEKAQRWCEDPAWVHMDTTPFASLLRNAGTLSGLGLGLSLAVRAERAGVAVRGVAVRGVAIRGVAIRGVCILISLLLLQILDSLTFSSDDEVLFYALSFGKSGAALLVPTALVPRGVALFLHGRKED